VSTAAERRGTVIRLPSGKLKIGIHTRGRPRKWETKPAEWSEADGYRYAAEQTALAEQQRAQQAAVAALDAPKGETPTQYSERWLAERRKRLHSNRQDRSRLKTHVLPVLGDKYMADVTRRDLEVMVQGLDERIQDETLSWRTARHAWGLTSKMFDDATNSKNLSLRVLSSNPAAGVRGPDKGDSKAKQWLYPTESTALDGDEDLPLRWQRIYALMIYLYPRPGELEALDWADVDLDHGTVHFHQAIDRERGEVKPTKTGHVRRIRIEPNLLPLLRAMRAQADGKGRVVSMPPVEDLSATLRDHLQRAGVTRRELFDNSKTQKRMTFYDLRATGITWRAVRGDDPLAIMQDAGHLNFSTTQMYIRTARVLAPGFGEVFGPLPASLIQPDPTVVAGLKNAVISGDSERPQRDLNPRYSRERAGSWAGLDDGDGAASTGVPSRGTCDPNRTLGRVQAGRRGPTSATRAWSDVVSASSVLDAVGQAECTGPTLGFVIFLVEATGRTTSQPGTSRCP
jgi:integrase